MSPEDKKSERQHLFGQVREQNETIDRAEKAVAGLKVNRSSVLETIVKGHGPGPYKLDGKIVKIRKVPVIGYTLTEFSTEAEEV